LGVALQGVMLGTALVDDVAIDGGVMIGFLSNGTMAKGSAFEGAKLQGNLSDGTTLPMRIETVQATNDAEIFQYTVSYWNGAAWKNLCGTDAGAPIRAIPLAGRWDMSTGTSTGGDFIADPNQFTFACEGAAIAKCVGAGYAPWRTVEECFDGVCQEIDLGPVHQACTRMIRADYCGDGEAHTKNGTPVDIYDAFGLQLPVNNDGTWQNEAEWSAEGALCIENLRWNGPAMNYIQEHCPERLWTTFACFGQQSTFFAQNGFSTPLTTRSVLRNESIHDRSVLE
jgi:hypothetical protein